MIQLSFAFVFFGLLVLAFIFVTGLRVAAEYERAVVFRLGRLKGTRGPGLYWLIPLGIETQASLLRVESVK